MTYLTVFFRKVAAPTVGKLQMTKHQAKLWVQCGEKMNTDQRRAWSQLLQASPADFLQLTYGDVHDLDADIAPIYLMYAKATGKGPSSITDAKAYTYLLMYDKILDALKDREKKVRRCYEICRAVNMYCVAIFG